VVIDDVLSGMTVFEGAFNEGVIFAIPLQ